MDWLVEARYRRSLRTRPAAAPSALGACSSGTTEIVSNEVAPGMPYVLPVLGPPASGKSTISPLIAERWGLPVVSKDALKELLFDMLGVGDVAWSVKLGQATFALLEHVVELQVCTGRPFLIDAAYSPRFENATFQHWQERYGFTAVQILCTASADELAQRFTQRALDGTRHAGHVDSERIDEFVETLDGDRYGALDLRGPILHYASDQSRGSEALLRELARVLPTPTED